jgi:hypothetical protein
MTDYLSLCAKLRPLMTRAEIEQIYSKDRWDEHKLGGSFGIQLGYGPDAPRAPDAIARDHIVERVSFEAPFSADIPLYGFAIGMAREVADVEIARLGLDAHQPANPDYRNYTGTLPDDFEIMLQFKKDRLERLILTQPNHSKIEEERRQFRDQQYEKEQQQRQLRSAWKSITGDDDAMLLSWAQHCKPWENSKPSEFMRYAEWLRTADPDQRHVAALAWNWDYGLAPLIWISRRDNCDLATALRIFFGCCPEFYLNTGGDRSLVADGNLMTFDLMMDIKDRIERGFYQRSSISFDLTEPFEIIERYKPTPEQRAALIPANLPAKREGRRIDYYNGFGGVNMPAFRIN